MTSTSFRSTRPAEGEFLPYYGKYIDLVPSGDIVDTLKKQLPETLSLIGSLSDETADKRYAPGKWSIRESIGHLIDGERIFVYRALRFSRADSTPVPGFDENSYAANGPWSKVSVADLADEYEHVRRATIQFFSHLDNDALSRRGSANGAEITPRALAFIIAGHERHHLGIIRDRYLNS